MHSASEASASLVPGAATAGPRPVMPPGSSTWVQSGAGACDDPHPTIPHGSITCVQSGSGELVVCPVTPPGSITCVQSTGTAAAWVAEGPNEVSKASEASKAPSDDDLIWELLHRATHDIGRCRGYCLAEDKECRQGDRSGYGTRKGRGAHTSGIKGLAGPVENWLIIAAPNEGCGSNAR